MKRVTPQPILPAKVDAGWHAGLLRLLREYSDSINQAADLRLWEFVNITAAYTAGVNDHVILMKPAGTFTLTIPAASVMRNKRIIIKRNNNTTHTITVQSTSGTIDGAASVTMTTAWQIKELYSDGVGWVELLGGTAGSAGTVTESFVVPISDQTTALTTGTAKMTFRMPYAFTLTDVRASVSTAQATGSALTFDINDGGTSILSTKLTIDNTEKTSTTGTAYAFSDTALANDAEITFDIDTVGDGTAKGAVITLIGHQ